MTRPSCIWILVLDRRCQFFSPNIGKVKIVWYVCNVVYFIFDTVTDVVILARGYGARRIRNFSWLVDFRIHRSQFLIVNLWSFLHVTWPCRIQTVCCIQLRHWEVLQELVQRISGQWSHPVRKVRSILYYGRYLGNLASKSPKMW